MSYLSRVSHSIGAILLSWFLLPSVVQADPIAYVPAGPTLTVVDLAIPSIEFIPQIFSGECIAITPDGTKAYVSLDYGNYHNSMIFPVNLATKTAGMAVGIGNRASSIAITPDGSRAYVCIRENNTVIPIDLATNTAGTPISIGSGSGQSILPIAIAIAPDGSTAYVGNYSDGTITPINLATNSAGDPLSIEGSPTGIAITPDGSTAYVCCGSNGVNSLVVPITLATMDVGTTIIVESDSNNGLCSIAITPDGSMAYVGSRSDYDGAIFPITLTTPPVVGDAIPTGLPPVAIAISPDGTTACITCAKAYGSERTLHIVQLDLATKTISNNWDTGVYPSQAGHGIFNGIAFVPDQAPTASFIKNIYNETVSFNGSKSSSPVGSIAMYDWDFGDGTRASSSYPETAHTYSTPGTFTVTLTVTNTSETSTKQVFTGQTVSRNGGPSAERSESVIVGPPDPSGEFVGRVHKNNHERKMCLKTTWKKSTSPGVAKYQIFSRNKKIKTISAQHSPKEYIRLHSHHHVSKSYRKHLSEKYRIRAVGTNKAASTFTQLRVVE